MMSKQALKSSLISAAKRATTAPAAAKAKPALKQAVKDDPLAIPDFLDAKNPKRKAEIEAGKSRPAVSLRSIASKTTTPKAAKPAKAKGERTQPAWVAKVIERAKRAAGISRVEIIEITGWQQPPCTQVMKRAAKASGLKLVKADLGYRLAA